MDSEAEQSVSVGFGHMTRYSRFILQLIGLWPKIPRHESTLRKCLRRSLATYSISGSFLLVVFKTLHLLITDYNLTTSISDTFQTFRFSCTLYKMVILFTERKAITELLQLYDKFQVPKYLMTQLRVLKKQTSQPTKVSLLYVIVLFVVTPLIIFLLSLSGNTYNDETGAITEKFDLPIQIWHPFNFKENPKAYQFIYTIVMLAFLPGSFVMLGFNMLYLSLAVVCARMLDHLSIVLRSLHSENTPRMRRTGHLRVALRTFRSPSLRMRSSSPLEDQSRVVGTLRYAVQHHQRTARFVDQMNAIFSRVILIDVLGIILAMCDTALHVTLYESSLGTAMASVQIFIIEMFYFSLLCWCANEVTLKSGSSLQHDCRHATWWSWHVSSQRVTRVVALRCNVPLSLCAGPFYVLSLDTFTELLGLSFSYFMFLYQMHK